MDTLEKRYSHSEFSQHIRDEYIKLLSVGKTAKDAEEIIIDYFQNAGRNESEEAGLWRTLALCEWEYGRLSPHVKEKALYLTNSDETFSIASRDDLLKKLNSPMPAEKKVRAPRDVAHCPWPVGSLLAYRIISSTHPRVVSNPFYKHYVLLRIINIKKNPISSLAPNDMWREQMLVGLYKWIGDSLPNPKIVDSLEFTAISIRESPLHSLLARSFNLPELEKHKRVETCCSLDWRCAKGIDSSKVFTYLSCDPTFQNEIPSFFNFAVTSYSLSHSIPFDSDLINRFMKLAEEKEHDRDFLDT